MREHWDGWGWVVPIPIFVVGFLRILYGREPFCGATDEHCLREWISALAGWTAVAAAVPSILYLAKQVRDADQHNRKMLRIELRSTYSLAKHGIYMTDNLQKIFEDNLTFWSTPPSKVTAELLREAKACANHLVEHVGRREWLRIQDEIGLTVVQQEVIHRWLIRDFETVKNFTVDTSLSQLINLFKRQKTNTTACIVLAQETRAVCKNHVDEVEEVLKMSE